MTPVFCEAVRGSRLRLTLRPLTGQATDTPARWDRTDHVSPCPQSADAATQVRADHLPERVHILVRIRQDRQVLVLDSGPIAFADIERYDDPDVESAVENYGVSPEASVYRLLRIDVSKILETRWFAGAMRGIIVRPDLADAITSGKPVPPVVVYRAKDDSEWFGLLDGVNRTFAHWLLGVPTIRAYELLEKASQSG